MSQMISLERMSLRFVSGIECYVVGLIRLFRNSTCELIPRGKNICAMLLTVQLLLLLFSNMHLWHSCHMSDLNKFDEYFNNAARIFLREVL